MKLGHSITYYLLNIMNYWRRRVKTACYIYTRVSTAMQVDGYSLDAQKDKRENTPPFRTTMSPVNTLTKVSLARA